MGREKPRGWSGGGLLGLQELAGADGVLRSISLGPTLLAGRLHLPGMLLIAAAPGLLVGPPYVADYLTIPISRLATEDNLRERRPYT